MSRVFITGSSAGLGLMAGRLLAEQGHQVVLHARDMQRANDAKTALPAAAKVVIGDASRLKDLQRMAEQLNGMGRFDAVIHNVGIGYREPRRVLTEDGLPHVFATNVIAPFVLTALLTRPTRLVYLSSGMHHRVHANLSDLIWEKRTWAGSTAYAESKLYDVVLAFAIARRWPDVFSNALEPGWVPTRMGGLGAPTISTKPTLRRHVSGEQRAGAAGYGTIFLSHASSPAEPSGIRHRVAGRLTRCLRATLGCQAPSVKPEFSKAAANGDFSDRIGVQLPSRPHALSNAAGRRCLWIMPRRIGLSTRLSI